MAYQTAARLEEDEDSKKPFQKNDLGEQKRVRKVSCNGTQMAVIVVLLKKLARFIVKITLALIKKVDNNKSPPLPNSIPGPEVPKFILNLVQRE